MYINVSLILKYLYLYCIENNMDFFELLDNKFYFRQFLLDMFNTIDIFKILDISTLTNDESILNKIDKIAEN